MDYNNNSLQYKKGLAHKRKSNDKREEQQMHGSNSMQQFVRHSSSASSFYPNKRHRTTGNKSMTIPNTTTTSSTKAYLPLPTIDESTHCTITHSHDQAVRKEKKIYFFKNDIDIYILFKLYIIFVVNYFE